MKHILKTDPAVFQAVADGAKTYEIRLNDRGFAVGDELLLRETTHTGAEIARGAALEYTGREITKHIGHVLGGYGLQDGWVILSFAERTTAPVSQLTDERLDKIALDFVPDRFVTAGLLRRFARAVEFEVLAAAPAPIQQEPVGYEYRAVANNLPESRRNSWVRCTKAAYESYKENPFINNVRWEVRELYAATPPALAGSQVQAAGDAGKVQAIKAAVSAIYFDDSSDYKTALWEVVQALDSAMAKLLEENPSAAYSQADAAAMREQP